MRSFGERAPFAPQISASLNCPRTRSIRAFALSGNDTLRLDETNGPLPAAALFGGDGADVLFAGSGDNVMFGGTGDDVLRGEEGDDVLEGGDGDDVLIGGAGDDVPLNGEGEFDE
jgi:Ca2+-binding RTX toxin-like protein